MHCEVGLLDSIQLYRVLLLTDTPRVEAMVEPAGEGQRYLYMPIVYITNPSTAGQSSLQMLQGFLATN